MISRVYYPRIVYEIEVLSNICTNLFYCEGLNEKWKDRIACSYKLLLYPSKVHYENVECMFGFRFAEKSFKNAAILNRIYLKKQDDQNAEATFQTLARPSEFSCCLVHTFDIKDFWKFVINAKVIISFEWTILVKHDIYPEVSLQGLSLQQLMRSLSKENVLRVLEIADIYGFKNLVDQCIELIQRHIKELKNTRDFASLKLKLKYEIFNRKKLIMLTQECESLGEMRRRARCKYLRRL